MKYLAACVVSLLFHTFVIRTAKSTPIISQNVAKSVLSSHKSKRSNTDVFEEQRNGNFERECMEEKCSGEELEEVFKSDQTVIKLIEKGDWSIQDFKLASINPCELQQSKPCRHINCTGLISRCFDIGTASCKATESKPYFSCQCKRVYKGKYCEDCKFEFYCDHGEPVKNQTYCSSSRKEAHQCQSCDSDYKMDKKVCVAKTNINDKDTGVPVIIENSNTSTVFCIWLTIFLVILQ